MNPFIQTMLMTRRPLHEMIRIPLIIYFNEKAYDEFKDKFKKYKILSQNKNVSTLSQLPMTILDLKELKMINLMS